MRPPDAPGDRDAPPAGSAPPKKECTAGPRAVPEPSRASKDRPTPRPIRPRTPPPGLEPHDRQAPGGETRPSGGVEPPAPSGPTPGAPGVRPERPSESGRGFDAKGLSDLAGKAGKATISRGSDSSKATRPTLAPLTRATPRPGVTQALKVGPGESGAKAQFTTHTLRGQDRVNVKQEVEVTYRLFVPLRPDTPAVVQRGRLVDISLGGAQIEGPLPPEAACREGPFMVRAEFALPFVERPLVADAHVTWTKSSASGEERFFMGLRFDALSEEQSNLIKGFLIGAQSPTRIKFRRGK